MSVKVYDITGRCCRTLVNSKQKSGYYDMAWDGRDNAGRTTARGVYFCQMVTSRYKAQKKIALME